MTFSKYFRNEKFFVMADQVVVSGSAFATNLLLAKALGLVAYGRFAGIGMVQLFLLSLSMGFGSQIYQVVYPSVNVDNKNKYNGGLFYTQVIFCVLAITFTVFIFLLNPLYAKNYSCIFTLASITTFLYLMQDFLRKLLLTQRKAKKAFYIDLVTNLLQLMALATAWHLSTLTINTALIIIGITFLPSVALGIFWLNPGYISADAITYCLKLHKSKSGWLIASSMLQWCTGYFFVIAAGWWIGAAALGALRLVQYIFGLLNVILQAVENYTLPKAVVSADINTFFKILLKKCFAVLLPPLLLLSLFAKQVLKIAGGEEYTDYAYLVYGLSIIYLLIVLGYPVRIAIRSRHLNKEYFTGYIIAMLFSFSTAGWLLKEFQLYGVLTGIFCTQLFTVGYWIIILQRKKVLSWKSFTWY